MWRIGWAPKDASKWQMGFNSVFKGLKSGNKHNVILTFKNRASYISDGRTATLQMLHFIYFFNN